MYMCEKNIYWVENFQLYGNVNINPELFYGGIGHIFTKVGLLMKATEPRGKTSVWEVFLTSYLFQQVKKPLHPTWTVLPRRVCTVEREPSRAMGQWRSSWGICTSGAPGWMFHWLVLLSGALEHPCRSEPARDCCPSSLLALHFQGRKLFY